ncbi:unnamed protein product [Nezara viridula]|uniref:Ig-like domain-containing protein n=1 Tax=Nezara viridula TaxID=85310 RepID=A0A9P0MFM6_NEZVI|nr:unnamed protein product [Nezara viridula]
MGRGLGSTDDEIKSPNPTLIVSVLRQTRHAELAVSEVVSESGPLGFVAPEDQPVSQAEILGKSELYIKSGSDISLTCVVRETPEPPSFIYWYRGSNVINYSQRGGISVTTEKQTRTSRLLIARALPADSGNYTCAPSSSHAASVIVHVLNEHPAAMQHGNSSCSRVSGLALMQPLFAAVLAARLAVR